MERLNENWITENHIDFEYKKYLLLAYLQHVSERFTETKLYPAFGELVQHYRNLVSLRDQKKNLEMILAFQKSSMTLRNK